MNTSLHQFQDMLFQACDQSFPISAIGRDTAFNYETANLPHLHHGLEIKILGSFSPEPHDGRRLWLVEQAIIVFPELVHSSFVKSESLRSISILFEEGKIPCVCCSEMLPETVSPANLQPYGVNVADTVTFLCSWAERKNRPPRLDLHASSILKSLLTALSLCISSSEDVEGELSPAVKAASYIRRHYYHNGLSVDDIAAYVGVTPNYLVSLFRKKTGLTVRQYLIKTRLEQAKTLLSGGSCLVKDAARLTGWNSAYYFSNCYRRHFGVPPSEAGTPNVTYTEGNGDRD